MFEPVHDWIGCRPLLKQKENVQNVGLYLNQRRWSGSIETEFMKRMYKMRDFIQTKGEGLDAWRQSSWMIIYQTK